ncbi:MAG: hypothetical protein JNL29_04970 [Nitrospira sp.]|nr:hypothetical protein [Nitrospira sp.]
MVLQAFSDVTFIDETGTRLLGPGEIVNLPLHDAIMTMTLAREHFKILSPTPILLGVTVCWSLHDNRVRGPAIVQMIEGSHPNRQLALEAEGELLWISEHSVIDCDPWPLIDATLVELHGVSFREGWESPKILEVLKWIATHFDADVLGR